MNEALSLFARLPPSGEARLGAVEVWNRASERLQELVNRDSGGGGEKEQHGEKDPAPGGGGGAGCDDGEGVERGAEQVTGRGLGASFDT